MTRICYSTRNGGERSALLRRSGSGSRAWSGDWLAGGRGGAPGKTPVVGLGRSSCARGARGRVGRRPRIRGRSAAARRPRVVPRSARGLAGCTFPGCFARGRRFAAPSSRRLATKARDLAEEPERDRGLPRRDRRPPRLVGGERAERSRRSDDRRLPERLPAAGPSGAGDLLPALSPPAPVPSLGQPTRRRLRPVPRSRAATEASAGARLADPRGVSPPPRRRRPSRAQPARPRRA